MSSDDVKSSASNTIVSLENWENLNQKYEKLKKLFNKAKEKLQIARQQLEKANLQKNEYYDELQVLKGVISVYKEQKRPTSVMDQENEDSSDDGYDNETSNNQIIPANASDDFNIKSKNSYFASLPNNSNDKRPSFRKVKNVNNEDIKTVRRADRAKYNTFHYSSLKSNLNEPINRKPTAFESKVLSQESAPLPAEPITDSVDKQTQNIFDENTVFDILFGLGITCSKQSTNDDTILVPKDYSFSYQYKMRRTQQLLKFKHFAPKVFSQIRQFFNLSNADLLLSFRFDNLDAFRGEGKSGAFFIFTKDKKFILKTSTGPERDFLWEFLPYYLLYIRKNPNTFLPRFYGVYSMKHEGIGGVIRFVIMNNWFSSSFENNEVYDLKGSKVGRFTISPKPLGILKDLDIKRKFYFPSDVRKLFLNQLYQDSNFLAEHNVMDYSLLVGIHYVKPEEYEIIKNNKSTDETGSFKNIFQQQKGGILGWNSESQRYELYYCGIIDILQQYTGRKKLEHFFKSIPYNPENISIVEPQYYAKRFYNFIAFISTDSEVHDEDKSNEDSANKDSAELPQSK